MSFRTKLVGILLATAFVVGTPLEAHAQGGFWEWIHRMSGPEFKATAGGRFSICLNRTPEGRERCGEIAVPQAPQPADAGFAPEPGAGSPSSPGFSLIRSGRGPYVEPSSPLGAGPDLMRRGPSSGARDVVPQADQDSGAPDRAPIEWLVGVGVQYGWSGDNADRMIDDVRTLIVEPNLRMLVTGVPGGSLVAGAGLGFHRFWHGTVPDPFWSTALILTVGYRLEFLHDDEQRPRWFLEAGLRGRYFFDRPLSQQFGGLPEPETDDGEFVRGILYVGGGYRFHFRFGG